MKTAGIIAEYNPFHQGHLRQISFLRENTKADYIIIAMSGDFVQRGAPALLPKHLRAEAALRCGADLVLELPVSVSCASAELFAKGGVELLSGIGVTDVLCFGSEKGSLPLFLKTAEILSGEPEEYRVLLKAALKAGLSFPAARSKALGEYASGNERNLCKEEYQQFLSKPNNILGIEYCKALLRQKSPMQPLTLQRSGAGYHDQDLSPGITPSASGIRKYLKEQLTQGNGALFMDSSGSSPLSRMLPLGSRNILDTAFREKRFVFEEDLDMLLFYCLLSGDAQSFSQYLDVSGELASRIERMRNQYQGFLQFAELLKTKELTRTRIQRSLLHIILKQKNPPAPVGYARVLGFRKSAAPLLSAIKKNGALPLLTKAADASAILEEPSLKEFQETVFASNLYEGLLSQKTKGHFLHEMQKNVIII